MSSKSKIGSRVGAFLSCNEKEIQLIGYGVYEGDFIPKEVGGLLAELKMTNPRIKLDSGKVVYGCECWWGPEDNIKKMITDERKIVDVDIDQVRARYKGETDE